MRAILIFSLLLLSGCSSLDISRLLNDQELLAETALQAPPLNVKVIRLTEHGECYENVCPLGELYIAVSEYGEYPKQAYYVTPKRQSWSFVKWIKHASFSEEVPSSEFVVSYKANGRVNHETISVSLEAITYKR